MANSDFITAEHALIPFPARILTGAPAALAVFLCAPAPCAAGFTEAAAAWGVAHGDSMSYAAGFVDYDGDADPDLHINNHWKGPAFLFRNDGAAFSSNSAHYGSGNSDRHDQLWADFDGDGDPDQYIIHSRNQNNEFFWNLGCDRFVDGAAAAGVEVFDGRGREITVADFDADGLLDIFLVNVFRAGFVRPNRLFWNQGDGTFIAHPNDDPVFGARQHVASADYDLDGFPDLVITDDGFNAGVLWRNGGDSTFTDVTFTAFPGITDPLDPGQGLSWEDYDRDGWLDLLATGGGRGVWEYAGVEGDSLRWYVEPDIGQTRTMEFVTTGDSVTVDATQASWAALTLWYGGAGSSVGTFPVTLPASQLDGVPPALAGGSRGLFLHRIPAAGADTVRLVVQSGAVEGLGAGGSLRPNGSGILSWSAQDLDPPPPYSTHDWSNRLYRNQGDGTFVEVTSTAFPGQDSTLNSKGAAWGDYDNDGLVDVFVANGGTVATKNQPNNLFRNNGDGTFTDVAAAEGVAGAATAGMTDGGSWGDVNGDGALDLFVNNGAEHAPFGVGPRELFLGTPNGNRWIRLDLRGTISNGSGIGARVRVTSATVGEQWRFRLGESDNCFSNEAALHFGLGPDLTASSVEIFWPSGQVDTYPLVAADTPYIAVEGHSLRTRSTAHFAVPDSSIDATVPLGGSSNHVVQLENLAGLASHYAAAAEDGAGQPAPWLTVGPESTTVWPGGRTVQVTVGTTGLGTGMHTGRIVFSPAGGLPPDTLLVSLEVVDPVGAPLPSFPDRFRVGRAVPNPTRERVALDLALPRPGRLSVTVHDVGGRRVSTVTAGLRGAGTHRAVWDLRDTAGRRVPSGVYLLRVRFGGKESVRKVTVLN